MMTFAGAKWDTDNLGHIGLWIGLNSDALHGMGGAGVFFCRGIIVLGFRDGMDDRCLDFLLYPPTVSLSCTSEQIH